MNKINRNSYIKYWIVLKNVAKRLKNVILQLYRVA